MVPVGPESIVVWGAPVSTTKLTESLPVLPAGSVALTLTVCEPSPSELVVNGEPHGSAEPPSIWQVTSALASSTVNSTVAVGSLVGEVGEAVIVTTGAVGSLT